MRKVALYTRVSQKSQSVERQINELREIAERNQFRVVSEYSDEGISGSVESRKGLNNMIHDALIGKFDTIMVLELSRLGRSVKNMCEIAETLKLSLNKIEFCWVKCSQLNRKKKML